MALPAYPNLISLGLVNTELGYASSTQSITLNDAAVRTLFVVSSGAIAMSDGHGKSAVSAPVFPSATMVNFLGSGTGSAVANYSVSDRTAQYYNRIDMSTATAVSSNATKTNTFVAATGGGITYEWQFLTYSRFIGNCTNAQNTTPLVGSAQTWNGPSGYSDSISGASTNSLTMTGYAYTGSSGNHSIAGYWRLKASNAAGATYTGWIQVEKLWGEYAYSCNCACPAGQSYQEQCNCQCPQQCQGTEDCNCTGCCTQVCDGACTCDCTPIFTCACGCDCDNPPDVHYPNGQCFGCCLGCQQGETCTGCCACHNENCTCDCSQCNTCSCADVCSTCTYCNVAEVCSTCYNYQYTDGGVMSGCNW